MDRSICLAFFSVLRLVLFSHSFLVRSAQRLENSYLVLESKDKLSYLVRLSAAFLQTAAHS